MRIWVLGRAYPSKANNYNGSFEFEQARMIASRGNSVTYFSVETVPFYKKKKNAGVERFNAEGVQVITDYFPYQPLPPFIMIRLREMRFRALLRKAEEKDGKPDVIHVHYPSVIGYRHIVPYAKNGVKIVGTEHWTKVLSGRLNCVYVDSLRQYRRYAHAMVSVGRPLQECVAKITESVKNGCLLQVVPNIVPDVFSYSPAPARPPFRLISIGRLVPCKRFDLLIDAFCQAFSGEQQVTLTIVGGGPEYENLKQKIVSLGLGDRVELTGNKPHDEVPALIKASHALVCASNLETFGVPVVEAMACGRPVVSTDAIGFLEFMNEAVGLIIRMDSEEEMIEALKKLYANYAAYDGRKISEYAKSLFSEEAVYQRLLDIYQS